MNTEFKPGDIVEVVNAEGCFSITKGERREVSRFKNGYVFLTSLTGGETAGWAPNRFKLVHPEVKPKAKTFGVGVMRSDGTISLCEDGKTYSTHEAALEEARKRATRSLSVTIAVVAVMTEVAPEVNLKEVSYEG